MKQAPSRVGLCARGSDQIVAPLEGRQVTFGPGSDCPHYLDPRTGQVSPFTRDTLVDCIHVVDALPELGVVDYNPDVNTQLRARGVHVRHGDISHRDVLVHAGVPEADIEVARRVGHFLNKRWKAQ